MKLSTALLSLTILLSIAAGGARARQASTTGSRDPRTPVARGELRFETDLPSVVTVGHEVHFSVTAVDGFAPRLNVRLVNPPEGLVFQPARRAPAPWTGGGHWVVEPTTQARVELVFEVESLRAQTVSRQARFTVPVRVEGTRTPTGLVTGDLTGDGALDVVAAAKSAVHVWAGSDTPSGSPQATLSFGGADLGTTPEIELALVRDPFATHPLAVVAVVPSAEFGSRAGAGAVFVWEGPFTGTLAPTRVLGRATPATDDGLGSLGVQVCDVTGDGREDIVTGSPLADAGSLVDAGVIVVLDDVTTVQELEVPERAAGDRLGDFTSTTGVRITDVTGDGILDLVSGARLADPGGVVDAGAVYVWHRVPPSASFVTTAALLRVPGAAQNTDQLGAGSEVLIEDVTGDGVADVVVGDPRTDFTPAHNEGALHVFEGGASLLGGTVSPKATLRDGLFHTTQDFLATGSFYHGTLPGGPARGGPLLVDVSGDGVLDVVARSSFNQDRGMVFAWFGGAGIDGEIIQDASCLAPSSLDAEQMGEDGILTADLDGDSVPDLVVPVSNECIDGALGAGAVHVWLGGAGFGGNSTPDAILRRTSVDPADALGEAPSSVRLADVTNDGLVDVLVCTPTATVGGTAAVGAVFVFAGDVALAGEVFPTAVLSTPAGLAGEALGDIRGGAGIRSGLRLADVTGDGVLDVIAGTTHATVGASTDAGHIQVWAGGPGLSGSPAPTTLSVSTAAASDRLGLVAPAPAALDFAQGLRIADVSGDGILDLVVGASQADGTVSDAGAVYVWLGGAGLGGDPDETIANPGAVASDQLARLRAGQGLQLADIGLDGVLDVLLGASFADPGGTVDAGAIYVRPSGGGLVEMSVPGAPAGDRLGY